MLEVSRNPQRLQHHKLSQNEFSRNAQSWQRWQFLYCLNLENKLDQA